MNLRILPLLAFTIFLGSCSDKSKTKELQPETPKALADKNTSFDYSLKRNSYNLVENLYQELLHKDANLKKLEEKIDALYNSKDDSLKKFSTFDQKNEAYFNAAQLQVNQIRDTVLKQQMNRIIAENLADYKNTIAKHKALLDTIKIKNLNISDFHRLLKITRTLPLIKSYQESNLPNTNSLEGYIKQQNQVILLEKELVKQ